MLLGEHKRGQCNESRIGQCTELSEPKWTQSDKSGWGICEMEWCRCQIYPVALMGVGEQKKNKIWQPSRVIDVPIAFVCVLSKNSLILGH